MDGLCVGLVVDLGRVVVGGFSGLSLLLLGVGLLLHVALFMHGNFDVQLRFPGNSK